jgi:hypothetical protein
MWLYRASGNMETRDDFQSSMDGFMRFLKYDIFGEPILKKQCLSSDLERTNRIFMQNAADQGLIR